MSNVVLILRSIAQIADVPEENHERFGRLLKYAVTTAQSQRPGARRKPASAGTVRKDFFDPVAHAARKLGTALERLQADQLSAEEPAQSVASEFFSGALRWRLRFRDAADPAAELLQTVALDMVIEVTDRATEHAKRWFSKAGRKKGTGRPAFDMFVMKLLVAAETNGGKLTIYKTSYGNDRWAGSLLQSVQSLRPLLPKEDFFPAGRLGSSLDTVYRRWRSESGKLSRKKPAKPAKK